MKNVFKVLFLSMFVLGFCVSGYCAAPKYKVVNKIHISGDEGWDYLSVDSAASRLYVSRGKRVVVMDTTGNTMAGEIPGTEGVHGIAIADEFNMGFTSNGKSNSATMFDLKTLEKKGSIKTGENPDAILYDPFSKKVFTFNGKSKDSTVIDAATGKVLGTIALGGKPEYACADGKGMIYVNIEDTAEVVEIDAVKAAALRRFSIKPGEEPTGIAMDVKNHLVFSGCHNKLMTVLDTQRGKIIAAIPVGSGVDGCGFDPGKGLAFCANGGDGTLTIVKTSQSGKFKVVQTAVTQKGARTMTVDEITHKVYLPTAEFGPMPVETPGAQKQGEGHWHRPPVIPGTFVILVVE
jgi:DNA-binding beta-propeller fold protein YncE